MKGFTFNKVYIIRSLNPNDKQLWVPGDELFNGLKKCNVDCNQRYIFLNH